MIPYYQISIACCFIYIELISNIFEIWLDRSSGFVGARFSNVYFSEMHGFVSFRNISFRNHLESSWIFEVSWSLQRYIKLVLWLSCNQIEKLQIQIGAEFPYEQHRACNHISIPDETNKMNSGCPTPSLAHYTPSETARSVKDVQEMFALSSLDNLNVAAISITKLANNTPRIKTNFSALINIFRTLVRVGLSTPI